MRVQLALNVDDLHEAIDFYTRMFGVGPAKTKRGYANFAIADPPLKLVLFEGAGAPGSINHLGVETETAGEVVAAETRLGEAGLETTGVDRLELVPTHGAGEVSRRRRPRRAALFSFLGAWRTVSVHLTPEMISPHSGRRWVRRRRRAPTLRCEGSPPRPWAGR